MIKFPKPMHHRLKLKFILIFTAFLVVAGVFALIWNQNLSLAAEDSSTADSSSGGEIDFNYFSELIKKDPVKGAVKAKEIYATLMSCFFDRAVHLTVQLLQERFMKNMGLEKKVVEKIFDRKLEDYSFSCVDYEIYPSYIKEEELEKMLDDEKFIISLFEIAERIFTASANQDITPSSGSEEPTPEMQTFLAEQGGCLSQNILANSEDSQKLEDKLDKIQKEIISPTFLLACYGMNIKQKYQAALNQLLTVKNLLKIENYDPMRYDNLQDYWEKINKRLDDQASKLEDGEISAQDLSYLRIESALDEDKSTKDKKKTDKTFKQLISKADEVKQIVSLEIERTERAFDLALAQFDEFFKTYPLHVEYLKMMYLLTRVRNQFQGTQAYFEAFENLFPNAAVTCN